MEPTLLKSLSSQMKGLQCDLKFSMHTVRHKIKTEKKSTKQNFEQMEVSLLLSFCHLTWKDTFHKSCLQEEYFWRCSISFGKRTNQTKYIGYIDGVILTVCMYKSYRDSILFWRIVCLFWSTIVLIEYVMGIRISTL